MKDIADFAGKHFGGRFWTTEELYGVMPPELLPANIRYGRDVGWSHRALMTALGKHLKRNAAGSIYPAGRLRGRILWGIHR